ncbi:MAG: class I SAM-dependent DNA methyltransferase, partial [Candidatus Methylumidiphilus sp.]
MTAEEFIARWQNNTLSERAGAQAHFDDLCELLGVAKPRQPGEYQFEYGATKASGGDGWADVWKKGCFGWENKKPGRDLKMALKQLTDYAPNLQSPPLLVVCDRERIEIHTVFNGYPDEPRTILLQDIGRPENLQTLRWVFTDPDKLKPLKSTAAITEEAAGTFAELAKTLRERGLEARRVAHFLIQCLFCMFAEDEGVLPGNVFTHLLQNAGTDTVRATGRLAELFKAMRKGGDYGDHAIAHFNGGLFKTIDVPPLEKSDLAILAAAAADRDWRAIEPAIFGTLFERGLNPAKRSQLGAHYTDVDTIMRLIDPVIARPLAAEWDAAKAEIAAVMGGAKNKAERTKAQKQAGALFQAYLERLRNFRVLDPACGSGNFLYLALKTLKDLEKRANIEAEALGLQRQIGIEVSPANVLGLELEPYAAELARVTVWIGELQWMIKNGYSYPEKPILKPLDTIENRDALINADGGEAQWPAADVIIGNPPFLGDKKMLGELGDGYVAALRKLYKGRVPGGADFVTYWFEKARAQIEAGHARRAGLVATNSIRGGASRKVLERICESGRIFEAWSDVPWWDNKGAAVRVSLICFGLKSSELLCMNGLRVEAIHADLTVGEDAGHESLTNAKRLAANTRVAFIGTQKTGAFDISGKLAREWLREPNPHALPNSNVVRPWANGMDITRRTSDTWIVDFGTDCPEPNACLYELPFKYLQDHVQNSRYGKRETVAAKWWLHTRPRPDMRQALIGLHRYLATPRVAKHRLFVWLPINVLPDCQIVVIARSDNPTFGVLHSRFHELWALRMGTSLEDRPRYTPTTTFETFPFPEGILTSPDPDASFPAIAEAAKALNQYRENWLNPDKWVDWEQTEEEAEAGFPKRPVAKPGHEADLKKQTLTNLYNQRPPWLDKAHQALDRAVAAA